MASTHRNSKSGDLNAVCSGAVAGLVATAPMTAVMVAIHRQLPTPQRQRRLPPEQITVSLAEKVAVDDSVSRAGEKLLTGVSHFGYGGVCGAAYGLYAERAKSNPLIAGPAFGLAVWAASYLGWLPALKIRRSATDEHAGINTMMIAAHLVWGASTAIVYQALKERRSE